MRSIHGGSAPASVIAMGTAMGALAGEDVAGWSDRQVRDGLAGLLRVVNQLDAVLSAMVASFEARGAAEVDGFRTARSWLEAFAHLGRGTASGYLRRGRLLRDLPALDASARAGDITPEHVRKVADLADHVGVAPLKALDELIASDAAAKRPHEFELTCRRIRGHLDPDGPDPDPDAASRRCLTVSRIGSLVYIDGKLDLEGGALLLTALDALTPAPTPDDPRTGTQRRADALVELASRSLTAAAPPPGSGVRAHLGILLTPQTLTQARRDATPARAADAAPAAPVAAPHAPVAAEEDRAARNVHGAGGQAPPGDDATPRGRPPDALECAGIPLPPELPWNGWVGEVPVAVAQRIACDCTVWRVVLDPATGLPLEVGRAHRVVPAWLRRALHTRDRGCRWPGCSVPAAWTEVHHLVPWYFDGESNVDNCLLLCRFHHGLVHHDRPADRRWSITVDHATGEVTVLRPHGRDYELGPSQPYRPRA